MHPFRPIRTENAWREIKMETAWGFQRGWDAWWWLYWLQNALPVFDETTPENDPLTCFYQSVIESESLTSPPPLKCGHQAITVTSHIQQQNKLLQDSRFIRWHPHHYQTTPKHNWVFHLFHSWEQTSMSATTTPKGTYQYGHHHNALGNIPPPQTPLELSKGIYELSCQSGCFSHSGDNQTQLPRGRLV